MEKVFIDRVKWVVGTLICEDDVRHGFYINKAYECRVELRGVLRVERG